MDTLTKEVTQLPSNLQTKWAEESSKMIEAEIASQFSYLADFVEKRATVANTAFVKLVGSTGRKIGFTALLTRVKS